MISLKKFNSFGIAVFAEKLIRIHEERDLKSIDLQNGFKILGGGTNILLTQDINYPVLKNEIKGIQILSEDRDAVFVKVGAGENWHEFVLWALKENYGGIENLSLIPGNVGAAPVQNIGAYGVELKDVLIQVEGYFLPEVKMQLFNKDECEFEYRSSIFKTSLAQKFIITSIVIRLTKKHKLNLEYGAIKGELLKENILHPTIIDVSNMVMKIRNSKLPDPVLLGNAGSFFKNASISRQQIDALMTNYPGIPSYPDKAEFVKVPAGWLIEQCGWKGKRLGNVGCYEKQALVLINYGNAKGSEILNLANEIIVSVKSKFGIQLVPEVNIW